MLAILFGFSLFALNGSIAQSAAIDVLPGQSIQAAIDSASNGDTINVAAGTFDVAATIVVNKEVTISGAGSGSTIVRGTGGLLSVFEITSGNVGILNLEVTLDASTSRAAQVPILPAVWTYDEETDTSLIRIPSGVGLTGIAISNNTLYVPAQPGAMGLWGHRAITAKTGTVSGLSVSGNTIYNTRNGVVIHGNNTATLSDNSIYNTKGGVMYYTNSQADADNRTTTGNSWGTVHNEWDIVWNTAYYVPDYQQSVLALSGANNEAYILDRRAADAIACANLTGNRSHVFVDDGGTALAAHPAKGNINEQFVTIALGLDAVVPGGKVIVAGGTYGGNNTITKSVNLQGDPGDSAAGPGVGAPVIDGGSLAGDAFFIANGVSGVTIKGFEIGNFAADPNPAVNGIGNGISAWEASTSNITIQDNYFHDLGWNAVLVGNDGAIGDHTNWTIKGNVLENYAYYGFELTNASNSTIEDNVIHASNSVSSVLIVARRDESGITVRNNQIDGTIALGLDGRATIYVLAWNADGGAPQLTNLLIEGNMISTTSDRPQIRLYDAGGTMTGVQVHNNSLTSLKNQTAGTVSATSNWWGDNDPSDNVTTTGGAVDYSPWLELAPGSSPMTWGTNDSIQEAIDAATAGDTINIAAGTYTENIRVNKSVDLAGSGVASTTIIPAVSLPNPCSGSSLCGGPTAASNVILVEADNVKIHDLAIDGDNPGLTSAYDRGGANVDARNGIIKNTAPTYNGLEVYNTAVRNIYLRGIYSTAGSFNFHDNSVTNVQGDAYSIAMFAWNGPGIMANNTVSYANDGIAANHSNGIQFLNNTVTNSGSGIHTDNAGDGGGVADLIQDNNVTCSDPVNGYGIFVFVPYIAPTVNHNTVTNCAVGLSAWAGAFTTTVTTPFTNNTVNGPSGAAGSVGAYITTDAIGWGYTDVAVDFTGNTITGNETGVYLTADSQTWNQPWVAKTVTADFSNNSITGNTYGMEKGTTGTYNASALSNWWGDASGPQNATSNPMGAGNNIADGIPFSPWLSSSDLAAPAVAYVAPTGTINIGNPTVTATALPGGAVLSSARLFLSWTDPIWGSFQMSEFDCTIGVGGAVSCPTTGLNEAVYTATVTVFDAAGKSGNSTGSFTIDDTTAPVTTDDADGNWHNADVTVTLSCTDDISGCASTSWSADNGGGSGSFTGSGGGSVTITNTGTTTITYHSVDVATNVETDKTATVLIDKAAPVTTDNADTNWHNTDVAVTLSCTDDLSGCASTTWSTNQGESGTGNIATVTITGDNTLTYSTTDVAGNVETARTTHVYIDKVNPAIAYTGPTGTVHSFVGSITASASDVPSGLLSSATLSLDGGVTTTACTVTGGNVDCPVTLADGAYTPVITVTDLAGNSNTATGSFTYTAHGQPELSLAVTRVYWASYADYLTRSLSAEYMLTNGATSPDAIDVAIAGAINTAGVILTSTAPVSVGDIPAAANASFTLKYSLPGGVTNFKTSIYVTAYDPCGGSYAYPGPYPGGGA